MARKVVRIAPDEFRRMAYEQAALIRRLWAVRAIAIGILFGLLCAWRCGR